MQRFTDGDRVRIDNRSSHHGKYGRVIDTPDQGDLDIRFEDGSTGTFEISDVRPVPNTDTTLYYRERDTLSNIWQGEIPSDLRDIEDEELLWEMRHQVAEAVGACYEDDDMDANGILFPLEYKITEVLSERM